MRRSPSKPAPKGRSRRSINRLPSSARLSRRRLDASTPSTIQSADAIVGEITQSVTVAVPGQKLEDNEEVEHAASTSSEHAATETAPIPDTETLALDGVN